MKILLVNNHTNNVDKLIRFLPGDVIVCDKDKFNSGIDLGEYSLIVFSGGSHIPTVMRHPDYYKEEVYMIQNTKLPILGICFGSEVLAVAFGGSVKELNKKIKGDYLINIKDEAVKNILGDSIKVFEGHTFGVDVLPDCFDIIADSQDGVEIFKHKEKPILGLQFHPEIDTNTDLKNWIFNELIL